MMSHHGVVSGGDSTAPAAVMPPLSPVRTDNVHGDASPEALDATHRPEVSATMREEAEMCSSTPHGRPSTASLAQPHNGSFVSTLSTGLLPDGFYYYYGSDDGLDSPSSGTDSLRVRHRAMSHNHNSSSALHLANSGSARSSLVHGVASAVGSAAWQPENGTSPLARGGGRECASASRDTPPLSPPHVCPPTRANPQTTASCAEVTDSESLEACGGRSGCDRATAFADLYGRRASQHSLLSFASASSRSPRSPAQRYQESGTPSRDPGQMGYTSAASLAPHETSRTTAGLGDPPRPVAGTSPQEGPAPSAPSPSLSLPQRNLRGRNGGDVVGDVKAADDVGREEAPHVASMAERRLFEAAAPRGAMVERQRHKLPVPAHAAATAGTDTGDSRGGDMTRAPLTHLRQAQKVAPVLYRLSAHTTAGVLVVDPVVSVEQLWRELVVQQVTPRLQAFFNPQTSAMAGAPVETVVIGYGFNGAPADEVHAPVVACAAETPEAVSALAQVIVQREWPTNTAPQDTATHVSVPNSELAWGHDVEARPEDDLLLLGEGGEELLRLGDTDLIALTAASAAVHPEEDAINRDSERQNGGGHVGGGVATPSAAQERPAVVTHDGVLLERACSEASRGLVPWITLAVASQAAARRIGQRSRKGGEGALDAEVCEELTMSVGVMPLGADGAGEAPVFWDLLSPLVEAADERAGEGGGEKFDRRVRRVPSTLASDPADGARTMPSSSAAATHVFAFSVRREEEALEVLSGALTRWFARAASHGEPHTSSFILGHLCVQFDLFTLQGEAAASPRGPRRKVAQPPTRTESQRRSSLRLVELCSHVLGEFARQDGGVQQLAQAQASTLDSLTTSLLVRAQQPQLQPACPTTTTAREDKLLSCLVCPPYAPDHVPLWIIDARSPDAFASQLAAQRLPQSHDAPPPVRAVPTPTSVTGSEAQTRRTPASTDPAPACSRTSPDRAAKPVSKARPPLTRAAAATTTSDNPPSVPRLAMERLAVPPSASPPAVVVPPLKLRPATTVLPRNPALKAGATPVRGKGSRVESARPARGPSPTAAAARVASTARPTHSAHARLASATTAATRAKLTTTRRSEERPTPRGPATARTSGGGQRLSTLRASGSAPRPLTCRPSRSPRHTLSSRSPLRSSRKSPQPTPRSHRQSATTENKGVGVPAGATAGLQRTPTSTAALEASAAAAHVARMAAGRERRQRQQLEAATALSPRSPRADAGAVRHSVGSLGTPRRSSGVVVNVAPRDSTVSAADASTAAEEAARRSPRGAHRDGHPTGRVRQDSRATRARSATATAAPSGVRSVSPAAYQRVRSRPRYGVETPSSASPRPTAPATETGSSRLVSTRIGAGAAARAGKTRAAATPAPAKASVPLLSRPAKSLERVHSAKPLRSAATREASKGAGTATHRRDRDGVVGTPRGTARHVKPPAS